jgi:hypothetical protein
MKHVITAVLLVIVSTSIAKGDSIPNFQFSKFGYQWTTSSGSAPGPGSFSPSHVTPLRSGIGLTLTETSSAVLWGGPNPESFPLWHFQVDGIQTETRERVPPGGRNRSSCRRRSRFGSRITQDLRG